jgi:4-hydroxythreonine-4-phosphate dehydrogenase
MKRESIPGLAITMGDPGGIGPEVIVKALFRGEIGEYCNPVVFGDAGVMEEAVRVTGLPVKVRAITGIKDSETAPGTIEVVHVQTLLTNTKGSPSKNAGQAIVEFIKIAVDAAMNGEVKAIVTAPISKESLKMAGYSWPGHTEMLAEMTKAEDFAMMFVSEKLKVILCTIHVPLRNVPDMMSEQLVIKTIRLAKKGMKMFGFENPRIAVSGLNPHAGETGIMGKEEIDVILPAIKKTQREGVDVQGPFPPDVVFHRAYNGNFDIIVCMYHDQGLIPFKMLAFETGVNVTVGLPVVRTSPDHGTAFDIAWKNRTNPSSMMEAIKLAATLKLPGSDD